MEKHTWQKVALSHHSKEPSPRWGHCSTTRENEIIFFGGYADSSYMSQVWVFDTLSMTWRQIKTGGNIPSVRSNCTIHYEQHSDSVIVFGGGGPNKQRFNALSILDWKTKEWFQLQPDQNQPFPWERTYHSSAMCYPYLLVFGGQGISDLDDLWVFNLQTQVWKEIKVKSNSSKPCARRFHTSVFLGNQFYVIAGCHGKYRSMGDIWRINLSELFQSGSTEGFQWEQLKFKGSSFLTRWGHTSLVFEDKIYVFGGRFCNDLQDIIMIDPERNILRNVRATGLIPKARRRHACSFVGGCMVIFGGFNGQYFNDLHYINVFEAKPRSLSPISTRQSDLIGWIGKQDLSDGFIETKDGKTIKSHKGLMLNRFESESSLQNFLEYMQTKYSEQELKQFIEIIYLGAGSLPSELSRFDIKLHETISESNECAKSIINPLQNSLISLTGRNKNEIYYLSQQKYSAYIERFHQSQHYDMLFVVGQDCIPVNKTLMAVYSKYFEYQMRDIKGDTLDFTCRHSFSDSRVFQILLNYLHSGYLVVPKQLDESCWILLLQLADYICLQSLKFQCEHELIQLLTQNNCEQLLEYSSQNNLSNLAMASAQLALFMLLQKKQQINLNILKDKQNSTKSDKMVSYILQISKFDLAQRQKRQELVSSEQVKRHSENNIEKENQSELQ